MNTEKLFRIILAILVVVMYLPRRYYQEMSLRTIKEGLLQDRDDKRVVAVQTFLLFLSTVALIILLIKPGWMIWSLFSFPNWLRWVGVVLTTFGTILILWTHVALGKNFFGGAKIRQGHELVVDGPYRWVRHPMYTAFILLGFGYLFLSTSWFVGLTWLSGTIIVLGTRLKTEEKMMLEQFGDEYRAYMLGTGRFLPNLGSKKEGLIK